MALSDEQRARIRAEAQRRGIDEAKLLAAAEQQAASSTPSGTEQATKAPTGAAAVNERPLYQYHLPFVTVNEVRQQWLGLAPITGGEENAAKYAARMLAAAAAPAGDAGGET